MNYQTKKKNFIKSLNNNMNLVEDSANSNCIGFDVATMREAYIQAFFQDEDVTVQQIHDDKLWMCA